MRPEPCLSQCPFLFISLTSALSDPQDAAYNCVAALLYLSASVLEALATILTRDGYTYKQYHENISAVVSPPTTHTCTHWP